jgi:predicted GTPase
MIDAISSIYNNGENQLTPTSKFDSIGKELSNLYKSNLSTAIDSAFEKLENFEANDNIIIQNLNISDEVLKLIVIGDKAVGKSLLIDRLCGTNNQSFSSTQRQVYI